MPQAVCDGDAATSATHAEWSLPAEAATVATVRNGVRRFARAHGASEELLIDLALAVTEAVTNAIVHAYVDQAPGVVRTRIEAAPDELIVTVADDGRGMQPRPDSPGLGLGLPTIARLTSTMDMHSPEGGGTVVTMTFAAPGVRGPMPSRRADDLLASVTRAVEGAWPEGLGALVDLLVPELADACVLDVLDSDGAPQRFAARIDGPDGQRLSSWLLSVRTRTDAPESATGQALADDEPHTVELTADYIARIARTPEDAEIMGSLGVRWWVVVPMRVDERRVGLLHFGFRPQRGAPGPDALRRLRAVAARAASALVTTQLISELRRTRQRFERILAVLGEAVTVQDANHRIVYANEAAARLLAAERPEALVGADVATLAADFELRRADGSLVSHEELPAVRLLAGDEAPPLLTRATHLPSGTARWLLIKATLLEDGERVAVSIIDDVTAATER
jgi:anti-sigma regulatory factor (Ser/Thr protein kinase)/PAS domain-containing protein